MHASAEIESLFRENLLIPRGPIPIRNPELFCEVYVRLLLYMVGSDFIGNFLYMFIEGGLGRVNSCCI